MTGQVVWITGCPCSGKTFAGDYLVTQGFVHVDGDGVSYSKDPEDVTTWKRMLEAFGFWFRGEVAPEELWQDHYKSICAQAAASLAEGKSVVITFAIYPRRARDFVRVQLPEVRFIRLEASEEELVRRNYERAAKFLEGAGMSFEAFWDSPGDPNVVRARAKYGEWSYENFKKWQLQDIYPCLEPFGEDEDGCSKVDNNKLDGSGIGQICAILGLARQSGEIDAQAIKALNLERYKQLQLG